MSPCLFCFLDFLCQVLEHIGFPIEHRLKHNRGCEITLAIDRSRTRPRAFHLPPPRSDEDEPTHDSPRRDLSPIAEHTGELPAPVSPVSPAVSSPPSTIVQVAPASVPQTPMPSAPPEPSGPMPTARSNIGGLSTFYTAPVVHYPLCQGLSGSHGDGPHILNHDRFICSFTDHSC